MRYFNWSTAKNETLKAERGVSFEQVVFHIASGDLLDEIRHPNEERYANQRVFVVRIENYVYLVPFVKSETEIFLKTIIPSRKATKKYLPGE